MNNVICTSHLGYVTKETYENYYGIVVDQILAFIDGKPINVANPEALKQ
jgi:D-3-phosphoglycerate dehydrogenase